MDLVVEWEEFEKDNYDSGEYAAPYKNDPVFSDDSDVDVCTSVAGARADIKKKIRLINCSESKLTFVTYLFFAPVH